MFLAGNFPHIRNAPPAKSYRAGTFAAMRFAALTIGAGVPAENFGGVIAAVYSRACLMALPDGALLSLVRSDVGSLPCGITVAAPAGFSLHGVVDVGHRGAARGGILRID